MRIAVHSPLALAREQSSSVAARFVQMRAFMCPLFLVLTRGLAALCVFTVACGGKVALAPGLYGCTDSEHSVVPLSGTPFNAYSVGAGTLTIGRSDSLLTAEYDGELTSTFAFSYDDGSGAGSINANQTWSVVCANSRPTDAVFPTPAAASVESGSLAFDGTTITIELRGTVDGGACTGQQSTLSISCDKATLDLPGYTGNL